MKKPESCSKCPLFEKGEGFVKAYQVLDPKLLIQGEAPGKNEIETGKPFVGLAGQWLRQAILRNCGVKDEEVIFDNTIRCLLGGKSGGYPTGKARKEAEHQCRQYDIWEQLPNVPLLVTGAKAINQWMGSESVGKWNGHIEIRDGRRICATYHPSAVMRNPNLLPLVIQHVRNLLSSKEPKHPLVKKGYIVPLNDRDFTFDLEWDMNKGNKITAIGVSYDGLEAYSTYANRDDIDWLRDRLVSRSFVIGGHNIIDADLPVLGYSPEWIRDNAEYLFDTKIASHVVHLHFAELGLYGLSDMCKYYEPTMEWKDEKDDLREYNGRDVGHNHRLRGHLERDLRITGQRNVFLKEQKLAAMALAMHQKGIALDVPALEEYWASIQKDRAEYRETCGFNPNSPKQIKEWAKEKGIKLKDTTIETLKKQEGKDESFDRLIDFRENSKSLTTWFPYRSDGTIGAQRINASINVTGTSVGRPSSSDPNIFNIPEGGVREMSAGRTRVMPNLRRFLLAEPDTSIFSWDYSGIEHRTVAYNANDWKKLADLDAGIKTYTVVAARHYGVSYENVTKAQYRMAKTVVLASDYCETAGSLALRLFGNRTRGSVQLATDLQAAYFSAYPDTKRYQDDTRETISRGDYTFTNPFGRQRKVFAADIHERTKRAVHFMGCSTAADVVSSKAVQIWVETGLVPFQWVYDELAYCLPKSEEGAKTASLIWDILEEPFTELPDLRLPVELKVGPNYGHLEPLSREELRAMALQWGSL